MTFPFATKQVQNNLARPFPFIKEVEVVGEGNSSGSTSTTSSSSSSNSLVAGTASGATPDDPKSSPYNISRLNFMVSAITKSVRKSATTAYERIGEW